MPDGVTAVGIDLDIEGAVITSVLALGGGTEVDARVWGLEPGDFYSDDHKALWRGILELRAEGVSVDCLTLANRLRAKGLWSQAAGSFIEALRVDAIVGNAGDYAAIVKERARERQAGRVLEGLRAEIGSAGWVERARGVLDRVGGQGARKGFKPETGEALSVRLPPRDWLIKELGIRSGPVTLYAGSSDSAKTLSLQAMAISVVCGRLVWNRYEAKRGNVLHIDYEQGRDLTLFRYQRLALAMGVWDELWAGLHVETSSVKPYLDEKGALEELEGLIRGSGAVLCVVDSLRAAFAGMEENDSKARVWLDKLKPVSESTGCVIVPIHHLRKPSKESLGGAQASLRGSGALYEAAQQVIVLRKETEEPGSLVIVQPNKGRLGKRVEMFSIRISDVPIKVESLSESVASVTDSEDIANETGSLRYGLDVSVASADVTKSIEDIERMAERILRLVWSQKGISNKEIKQALGVSGRTYAIFDCALKRLVESGRIDTRRAGHKVGYFPAVIYDPESESDPSCQ